MNNKAKIATEILIVLIVIVVTSATILLLVKTGVIGIKDSREDVLDSEFIPYTRGGSLAIKDFEFCGSVDAVFECVEEKTIFSKGDDVYFVFTVEISSYDGKVSLVENYRVKGPTGEVLLEADSENDFYFDRESKKTLELVIIQDYIITEESDALGEYTLELVITNPSLNKKTTLIKKFSLN